MPRKRPGIIRRLLGWLGFHLIAFAASITVVPRPDVILVPSPLLSVGVLAWLLGCFRGSRFIYNVQELYPDLAVKLGVLRNPAVIGVLRFLEKFVYAKAAAVTVIGYGMRHQVVHKGVPEAKVHLIPNFVDTDDLQPLSKHNRFSISHGVTDCFVVSYAGNMGLAQGLETLLETAHILQDERNIRFMFIGGGVSRLFLEEEAEARGLSNTIFVPHQSYTLVPQIYGASDVCIVPMVEVISTDAVPSKVFRIMACSRPVLAITDPASDLARVVNEARAGVVVQPGSARAVADAILALFKSSETSRSMGENGRRYAVQNVSRQMITGRYVQLIEKIIAA
jgi:colanic acid biosynthesis glycosyl transferase WcaI